MGLDDKVRGRIARLFPPVASSWKKYSGGVPENSANFPGWGQRPHFWPPPSGGVRISRNSATGYAHSVNRLATAQAEGVKCLGFARHALAHLVQPRYPGLVLVHLPVTGLQLLIEILSVVAKKMCPASITYSFKS
jgi:hypothetical protein